MGKRKERLPFWKKNPEIEHIATHLGKKFDDLSWDNIRNMLELIGITTPFVIADRKVGGLGVAGFGTGLLADYFIRHKTMLPKVTILGNTYEINAGYAMLMGVAGFLGLNAIGQYGIIPLVSAIDHSLDASAAVVRDQMGDTERAYKEYEDARLKNEPPAVVQQKYVEYIQTKVGPRRG